MDASPKKEKLKSSKKEKADQKITPKSEAKKSTGKKKSSKKKDDAEGTLTKILVMSAVESEQKETIYPALLFWCHGFDTTHSRYFFGDARL